MFGIEFSVFTLSLCSNDARKLKLKFPLIPDQQLEFFAKGPKNQMFSFTELRSHTVRFFNHIWSQRTSASFETNTFQYKGQICSF